MLTEHHKYAGEDLILLIITDISVVLSSFGESAESMVRMHVMVSDDIFINDVETESGQLLANSGEVIAIFPNHGNEYILLTRHHFSNVDDTSDR